MSRLIHENFVFFSCQSLGTWTRLINESCSDKMMTFCVDVVLRPFHHTCRSHSISCPYQIPSAWVLVDFKGFPRWQKGWHLVDQSLGIRSLGPRSGTCFWRLSLGGAFNSIQVCCQLHRGYGQPLRLNFFCLLCRVSWQTNLSRNHL